MTGLRPAALRLTLALTATYACALAGAASPDTRVVDAVMLGDHDDLAALLRDGADVNAAQGDGMTALHWAAVNEDVAAAEMLIFAGANVAATTRLNAVTPLWLAAETGNASMIGLLSRAGADADAAAATGVTPLMRAAAAGSSDAVHALVEYGADVNAVESTHGQTALMFAAAFGRVDGVEALLDAGADVDATTETRTPPARARPPSVARSEAKEAPADEREASGPPPDKAPNDPDLNPATLAAAGSNEPLGGLTALLYAARQGHGEVVEKLLDHGADIDRTSADSTTPLMMTTINGHFDLAMYLLERGADPKIATQAGGTPLYRVLDVHWAPKSFYPQPDTRQEQVSYLDLMTALLERGADPNARLVKELWYTGYGFGLEGIDPAGATPFWRAAQVGDVDAMRLLIARGADPSVGTEEGISPLMVLAGAGFHGNDAIVIPAGRMPAMRYLVEELGADVNEIDAKAGEVTRIEHQNTRGYTAIHNAAARGDNEMILYLVSKGARVDLVGPNGVTSVDMANSPRERIEPFPETIELLESLGAKNSHHCVSC